MEIPELTPLCEIAFKYGTDKCPQIKHYYTTYYYKLFKDKRESVKKVLEMGIGKYEKMKFVDEVFDPRLNRHYVRGASLKMWREFFPNAMIYGADNAEETMFEEERIKTFLVDERVKEQVEDLISKTGPDIDLFVDDGSHHWRTQMVLCQMAMPLLNKGVTYIIEDVAFPNHIMMGLRKYNCHVPKLRSRFSKSRLIVVTHK